MKRIHNQRGVALVVVLLALVLLTAMVVEFSYGVYTGTNDLYNWRDSQRLSVMAKSGVTVAAGLLRDKELVSQYTEYIEMPVENPFEDFKGVITLRIEDEDAKFNLNAIVPENDLLDESDKKSPYNCFVRLLAALKLDETIADRVVDWIDRDSAARLSDSEAGARNGPLDSVDELMMIRGISKEDYDKLLPYVSVNEQRDLLIVNVNRAELPVLMSLLLSSNAEETAKRIIESRKSKAFKFVNDFDQIAGTGYGAERIKFDGANFLIRSTASSEGVKRVIETVFNTNSKAVRYWKEY